MNRLAIACLLLALPTAVDAAGRQYKLNYPASKTKGELSIEANYYLWIPDATPVLRGVIVHQHGCGEGAEKGGVTASRDLHWQALAKKWNCALLGSSYRAKGKSCRLWCDPRNGSDARFRQALADFAKQSGHAELATVPWCLWGHSGGAFWASLMQVKHPKRIVGIWLRSGTAFGYWTKGEIPKPEVPQAAYGIPVVCNPGRKEKTHKRFRRAWDGALAMFKAYRAKDAPIAFVPDPKTAHECGESRYAAIPFFDACLAMRLPKTGSAKTELRPVEMKRAFLSPFDAIKASGVSNYKGDPKTASWLIGTGSFIMAWAQYAKSGRVGDSTPPPSPVHVFQQSAGDKSVVLTWDAEADFETGLLGFEVRKDGKLYAKLPKNPTRRFGRPLFQGLSYHDTPVKPPELRVTIPFKDVTPGARFSVVAINTTGLKSKSAAAAKLPSTVAVGAKLEVVYGDGRFFEGPTWDPKGNRLYFTAFGKDNQQILRLDAPGKVTVWLDKTQGVNGTFLSKEGRLLGAQAFGHRVMAYKFGKDGPTESKVLHFDKKLNQPNDVCQAPNGDIYFTDPDFKNRKTSAVYKLDANGKVTKVLDDMPVPNGLITSLDGGTLYVGDSYKMWWRSYPILPQGGVGKGKVFFHPEKAKKAAPDGMTIDAEGNLYFSGRGGVWVVQPDGKSLGLIPVPEFCSNVCFGGKDGKTLFLTCSKKVYRLRMRVRGG